MVGFSDSDWAGDIESRRSVSGYMFQLCGAPISWKSKKQTSVALSTAEAEYMALSSAAQEAVWLRKFLNELKLKQEAPMVLYEDNQAAISMARNTHHGRTRHIDIRYHFVRETVGNGTVELRYCRSNQMLADILTKGLICGNVFGHLRKLAGIVSLPIFLFLLVFMTIEKENWRICTGHLKLLRMSLLHHY